eukprot:358605-Chlamydomonas_euryale.AAC.2
MHGLQHVDRQAHTPYLVRNHPRTRIVSRRRRRGAAAVINRAEDAADAAGRRRWRRRWRRWRRRRWWRRWQRRLLKHARWNRAAREVGREERKRQLGGIRRAVQQQRPRGAAADAGDLVCGMRACGVRGGWGCGAGQWWGVVWHGVCGVEWCTVVCGVR